MLLETQIYHGLCGLVAYVTTAKISKLIINNAGTERGEEVIGRGNIFLH